MVLSYAASCPDLTLLSGFTYTIFLFIHTFGSMTCTRPTALIFFYAPWNLVIFEYRLYCCIALFNACSLCFLMKITILLIYCRARTETGQSPQLVLISNEQPTYAARSLCRSSSRAQISTMKILRCLSPDCLCTYFSCECRCYC